ncbi:MAG: nitroreductase family protein [Holophagae bacterium]
MLKQLHVVDSDACTGDGLCVDVCPENAIELVNDLASTVEGRAEHCLFCGQCVAMCPTGALEVRTLNPNDFHKLNRVQFGYDEFYDFLRTRRSVRVFKDKPVVREDIDKILAAAATAPMGFPPHTTEIVVINEQNEIDHLRGELIRHYDSMAKTFSNPIGRATIRLSAGAETYNMLKVHVIESARYANELYRRDGTDRYMYHAPLVMLFHGSRWGLSYQQNAHLVCHHAMLAAVSLRLGTTIIGLIPPVVDRSAALRERYGIPKDNRVLTSLIIGHPKYRYRQSIRRDLASVVYH